MRSLFITFALVLGSSSALAQEPSTPRPAETTSYGFDDELVVGDSYDASAERLVVRNRATRHSLIEVKSSLVNELYKSVENL